MEAGGDGHAALVAALRRAGVAPDRVIDAFARVPRHAFLPGVDPADVYVDDAVVTHREDSGIPTSSSSQPSLMASMLARLDVPPGARVLEVGAGTGFNAALLADLVGPEGAVTAVELQPSVAETAAANLRAAAVDRVEVVCGDGARPPGGPYDRIIVTAGCWSLPPGLVGALADGGVMVAPLRVNGVEIAVPLRREGAVLAGAGGSAAADTDLGTEGRGALDRVLADPGREVADPGFGPGAGALDVLLWLGLRGDPLITLVRPRPEGDDRPPWLVGLASLPGSMLVVELDRARVGRVELHGTEAALRSCTEGLAAHRAAGSPSAGKLHVTEEPHGGRDVGGQPAPRRGGGADVQRGIHRWTFRYLER
jgi:protein-L-isoaspartate(D-aspartate) O-methyltransferase